MTVALVVLGVAVVAAARVAAMPAARRELREHPVLLLPLTAAGAAAIVVGTLATRDPAAAPMLAAVAMLAWAFAIWRAHPRRGRRRGRPPGSLGIRHSLHALADPAFHRREAARHGPVFKTAELHRPVACVVGIATGRRVLRDHGSALRPAVRPPLADVIPGGFLRYMTPAEHARYAPLFRTAMAGSILTHGETAFRTAVRDALTTLATTSAGAAGTDPRAPLERALARTLPDLFFGRLLRPEDQAVAAAYARESQQRLALLWAAPGARRALARFTALLAERDVGYDGTDDPSLRAALVRQDPVLARSATMSANLFLLAQDAQTNLHRLAVAIVRHLGCDPAWTARTREAADRDDAATRVVVETLRLADDAIYREVLQPITVEGFTVPRGWWLRVCIGASHRLDPPFAAPDRFDPDRHRGAGHPSSELAPFGLDDHACIAARLTLLFGRVLASELIDHFECRVVADGPPVRHNRHWALWEASPALRVTVRPREEPSRHLGQVRSSAS